MQVKMTDSTLVKWAVFELKLKILGRKKWAFRCACHELVAKEDWARHRCKGESVNDDG